MAMAETFIRQEDDVVVGNSFTNPTNVFTSPATTNNSQENVTVDAVDTDAIDEVIVNVFSGGVQEVTVEDETLIDNEKISIAKNEVEIDKNLLTLDEESRKLLDAKIAQDIKTTNETFTNPENLLEHQQQVELYKKNWSTRYGINTIQERDFFLAKEKEKLGDNFKENNYLPFTIEELIKVDSVKQQGMSEKRIETIKRTLKSPNYLSSGLTESLLSSDLTIGEINAIVFGDTILNPITALADSPYHFGMFQERLKEGKFASAAGYLGLAALDVIQANVIVKGLTTGGRAIRAAYISSRGNQSGKATGIVTRLEAEKISAINRANKEVADKNNDVRKRLIEEFETKTNSKISMIDENGHTVIDPRLSREVGGTKLDELLKIETGSADAQSIDKLNVNLDASSSKLLLPILNPEKLDGLVALVTKLRNQKIINEDGIEVLKFPNLSKKSTGKKGETLIDDLFNMTVDKDLLGDTKIYDMLAEHNLTFEDYILTVVGSGSDAGRLLNKLSQMKRGRFRNQDEIDDLARLKIDKTENSIKKFYKSTFVRLEGVRRGMMVSSIATAARNLSSAGIRMPLESLSNVMDAALFTYATKGLKSSVGTVIPFTKGSAWADSFKNMRLLASPEYAKEYTDFFLKRPEFADNFSKMFDNINEINKFRGRGKATSKTGKAIDKTISGMEDLAQTLNAPNRWQEFMVRRATFLSELQRRVKLEWDVDLIEGLEAGKFTMNDLMGDVSTLKKSGAADFKTIMDDSIRKALDVTYAKTPDFKHFRTASNIITESGATVFIPFPRFMFNAMEFTAEHSAGALLPAMRRVVARADGKKLGPLTTSERRMVSRNMMGLTSIVGLMMYRNSEDAPADYKMIPSDLMMDLTDEETQFDTTTLFPVRQALWIVEAIERSQIGGLVKGSRDAVENTLGTWSGFDKKEVMDVFFSGGTRTGVANVFVQGIVDVIDGMGDETSDAKFAKILGDSVGQYLNSFFTPVFQLVEGQRNTILNKYSDSETTMRPTEYKEFRGPVEDNLSNSFWEDVSGASTLQLKKRGAFSAPSTEKELSNQENIFVEPSDGARINIVRRLYTGFNTRPLDTKDKEWLINLGYQNPDYDLASRKEDGKARAWENREIRKILPIAIEQAKEAGIKLKEKLMTEENYKEGDTLSREVAIRSKEAFKSYVRQFTQDPYWQKGLKGSVSPLSAAITRYSSLPKEKRSQAKLRWRETKPSVEIDFTNLAHIKTLIKFSNVYK